MKARFLGSNLITILVNEPFLLCKDLRLYCIIYAEIETLEHYNLIQSFQQIFVKGDSVLHVLRLAFNPLSSVSVPILFILVFLKVASAYETRMLMA